MAGFMDTDIGVPLRSPDLKPLLDRIAALEAQAQADEREWKELVARIESLEAERAHRREAFPGVASPVVRDLLE